MGVSAVLSSASTTVAPGSQASCQVRVRNTGAVVDQFVVSIIGDCAEWTQPDPAVVNLFPAAEQTVQLIFAPPKSVDVRAGEYPFAVRLRSTEDPEGSVVEEAVVMVEQFTELAADLVPRASNGRRRGKHTVAVDNVGNHPVLMDVRAADPDDRLAFTLKPRSFTAIPGTATFVKLKAHPKKQFWKGQDKTLPFQVEMLPQSAAPIPADGVMVQRQLLPRGLLAALSILIALLLLLMILLNTILSSTPISTARTTLPPASTPTPSAGTPTPTATAGRPSGGPDTGTGTSTPGGSPTGGESSTGPGSSTSPNPVRTITIRADATAREGDLLQTFSYAVPVGQTFQVTGVRLLSPAGDSGVLDIRRGSEILLSIQLGSFRTETFRPSWPFAGGQEIVVAVECRRPSGRCTPTVALSGRFARSGPG